MAGNMDTTVNKEQQFRKIAALLGAGLLPLAILSFQRSSPRQGLFENRELLFKHSPDEEPPMAPTGDPSSAPSMAPTGAPSSAPSMEPTKESQVATCLGFSAPQCAPEVGSPLGNCTFGKCENCFGQPTTLEMGCYTWLYEEVQCMDLVNEAQCIRSLPFFTQFADADGGVCYWENGNCQVCTYCATFTPQDPGTTVRQLFGLMQGEELEKHLVLYEEELQMPSRKGLCDHPRSTNYGRRLTSQECLHPDNLIPHDELPDDRRRLVEEQAKALVDIKPWAYPLAEKTNLIASNPGIWSIENFLDQNEIDMLIGIANKYGHDLDMFGPCRDEKKDMLNAHPGQGKECFKISPQNVCDGPYGISKCDTDTQLEDAPFINSLMKKVKNVWKTNMDPHPYAKFQLTSGGTGPMHLHYDRRAITFIFYVNDGGAGTIFPNANITLTPKRGLAYTWLNYDENGRRNTMADHMVQANPQSAGERLSVSFEMRGTPENFLASQSSSVL